MEQKPFVALSRSRTVIDLPSDLASFYSQHDGIGLESSPDVSIRLCKLREIRRVDSQDILVLKDRDSTAWRAFSGLSIGIDSWFDDVVYVLSAPCCDAGTIVLFGPDVAGSPHLENALILASSFDQWLVNLQHNGWVEYGACPGGLVDKKAAERDAIRHYYNQLNPRLEW